MRKNIVRHDKEDLDSALEKQKKRGKRDGKAQAVREKEARETDEVKGSKQKKSGTSTRGAARRGMGISKIKQV